MTNKDDLIDVSDDTTFHEVCQEPRLDNKEDLDVEVDDQGCSFNEEPHIVARNQFGVDVMKDSDLEEDPVSKGGGVNGNSAVLDAHTEEH